MSGVTVTFDVEKEKEFAMQKNGNLVFAIASNGGFDIETENGMARVVVHRIGDDRFKVVINAPKSIKINRHRTDLDLPAKA